MSFHFSAINLGCSKNMVDLEFTIGEILKYADRADVEYVENPEDVYADYVIVNTCGFLSSARTESEETLTHYDNLGKKLILMWCYVSVKDDAFLSKLKNLHSIIPFTTYSTIEELVLGKKSKFNLSAVVNAKKAHKDGKEKTLRNYLAAIEAPWKGKKAFVWKGDEVRAYIHAPFGYEFLKVAEWCDNNCTFCIIPTIRGRQTSRKMEDILKEVRTMLDMGIQEIQIISQDTTRYGTDIYGQARLVDMLESIDGVIAQYVAQHASPLAPLHADREENNSDTVHTPKYRVYYLYPDILTLTHLERLKNLQYMLPYFDIPFQHASENVLKLMWRHYDRAHIDTFIEYIRAHFPLGGFIRTSFIIGFPGETDTDFQTLYDFVEKYRFESVGIFQYHDELLAASSRLPDKVPEDIAKVRIEKITKLLHTIYDEKKALRTPVEQVGYVMSIQDSPHDKGGRGVTIRPEIHAPEVDDYDEVDISQIHTDTIILDIGMKVRYSI